MPTRLISTRKRCDDILALRTFIRERQKNWKHVMRDLAQIRRQYLAYEVAFDKCAPYPAIVPRSTRAAALHDLYDQKPKCLAYIDELRRKANKTLAVCPYCGLPGRLTLDHYLPRKVSAYPHFSAFSLNLVPACDACQSAKHAFFPNADRLVRPARHRTPGQARRSIALVNWVTAQRAGRRPRRFPQVRTRHTLRILHPKFDTFLKDEVWKLRVQDAAKPLRSLVLEPTSSSGRRAELVGFHIKKLAVNDRSQKDVWHWLRFLASLLQAENVPSLKAARTIIARQLASSEERDLTPNSIACAVIRAVHSDDAILNAVLVRARQLEPVRTVRSQGVVL